VGDLVYKNMGTVIRVLGLFLLVLRMTILIHHIGNMYYASYFDGIYYAYGTGFTEQQARDQCELWIRWFYPSSNIQTDTKLI
jgi:hypothetical protein